MSVAPLFLDSLFGNNKMAGGLIGSINAFDAGEETWSSYVERLEIFIDANDIKEEKKVSTLLTVMGLKTYTLVKNLCAPVKPSEKSFSEIVELVETHLSPKPSFIAERYKFSLRNQMDYETIADYVVQLKQLSMFCEFKNNLSDYLRDKLVSGLKSDAIKKRLLSEPELTFEKAVSIATTMEMADRDAAQLTGGATGRSNEQSTRLHYNARRKGSQAEQQIECREGVLRSAGRQHANHHHPSSYYRGEERVNSDSEVKCFACGKKGHKFNQCRFRSYKCNKCGKEGHLAKVCKFQERGTSAKRFNKTSVNLNKQNYVEESLANRNNNESRDNSNESSEDNIYDLSNIFNFNQANKMQEISERVRPIVLDLKVDRKVLKFEVDSGACVSVINEQCYRDHFSTLELSETSLVLSSYTNQPIKPLGKLKVQVTYENKTKLLTLYVIAKGANPLMGRDWIRDLGVVIKIPHSLASNKVDKEVKQTMGSISDLESKVRSEIYQKFPEVFTDNLGCYKGEPAGLELKQNVTPKFLKPRPIPFALKEKVEAEIDRLVEIGILTPVSNSEWGSPVVPILKKTGELR